MPAETFALLKDLDKLTQEERYQHMVNVCNAAGLDPSLGLLRYHLMDNNTGTGEKHLVLYATKGATNAIREIKEIDVFELTDKVISGAVVFTAKARNKKGRTDIAVGAAAIEGKRGKALENAFALAQTRATRRVTLQMSGLDLLDESEITNDGTSPLVDAPVPLAEIGQPVEASSEPGKDITGGLAINLGAAKTEYHVPLPLHVGETVVGIRTTTPAPAPEASVIVEDRIPNPAAGLKPVTANSMSAPDGPSVKTIPAESAPVPEGPTPEQQKQRRKRRTKAEMEAACATEVSKAPVSGAHHPQGTHEGEICNLCDPETDASTVVEISAAEIAEVIEKDPPPESPKVVGTPTTREQMDGYVVRLTKVRDTLIDGGMLPSNGLGPTKKVREFVKIANSNTELIDLTVEQWENTFRFFNDAHKELGVKKLIGVMEEHINKSMEETAAVNV